MNSKVKIIHIHIMQIITTINRITNQIINKMKVDIDLSKKKSNLKIFD
jgi:hypothetical protein